MTVRACDIKWDLIFHKAKLSWDLASLEETSDKTVRESANSCTYLQLPHCSNAPVSHIRPLPGQFDQLRPLFTSPFTCKSERADYIHSQIDPTVPSVWIKPIWLTPWFNISIHHQKFSPVKLQMGKICSIKLTQLSTFAHMEHSFSINTAESTVFEIHLLNLQSIQ